MTYHRRDTVPSVDPGRGRVGRKTLRALQEPTESQVNRRIVTGEHLEREGIRVVPIAQQVRDAGTGETGGR